MTDTTLVVQKEMNIIFKMNESDTLFGNSSVFGPFLDEVPTTSLAVQAAKLLRRICIPIIIAIGLCGNTLSLMVFSTQSMKKKSCSVFLGSMAAVDNVFLLSLLITWFDGEIATIITHDLSCQLLIYFTYVTSFLSVWFIVGFTLERFIAIRFPLKRQTMCSVRREKIVVVCMSLFAAALYNFSFWAAGMQKFDNNQGCLLYSKYFHFLNIVTWVDSVLTMVLPFFIIIIVNSLVLKTILHNPFRVTSASNRSYRTSNFKCSGQQRHQAMSKPPSPTIVRKTWYSGIQTQLFKSKRPKCRVARTLMLVSMTFLGLNLPSHAMRLYNLFSSVVTDHCFISEEYFFIQELTLILYYATFSCNFVIYTLCGHNFKKSLLMILKCKSATEESRQRLLERISSQNSNVTAL